MAPTMPQPPTCEQRSALSDAELYFYQHVTDPTAYGLEEYNPSPMLGRPFNLEETPSTGNQYVADSVKSATLPCCTQTFCDFTMPTVDSSLSQACVDASVCFDFACLDESCLEYAHTPCQEPGCIETTAIECDDPDCDKPVECVDCLEELPTGTTTCLECIDQSTDVCATCCMADICPNPSHAHLPKHHHPIHPGYMPWYPQQTHYAQLHSMCSSERSSVEPRLAAALQSSMSFDSSPGMTDSRSTPATFDSLNLDTPIRGGHRRLQGAAARQIDGSYMCHWVINPAIGMTCSHVFADAKGLHEHIQSDHFAGSSSNHPCYWLDCDSGSFNTKPKLARHLHSHTEYKPHKCDFPGCTLSFVTQQQRDVHRKKHTGEKPFACKVCGKAFAYMDLLKSHMRSGVHGQADKKFACVICGEGFSDSSNRTKHTKSVHDPLSGIPCPDGCGYVDTRREKLKHHCESAGHALEMVRNSQDWEDYFNREQSLRRPHKGHRRKRSAHQAGFESI